MKAPVPEDEPQRLQALRELRILDTPPERQLDDITLLAAQICEAPTALITFVDADRQWFKSRVGWTSPETSRDVSFCAHAILEPEKELIVRNAARDRRFAKNPLVTGDPPHIRFYAGVPLVTAAGHALGTLCVIDREPRTLRPQQLAALRALRRCVVAALELRQASARLDALVQERTASLQDADRRADRVLEDMSDGFVAFDRDWRYTRVNARAAERFGRSAGFLLGKRYHEVHPEAAGTPLERAYRRAMDEGEPAFIEERDTPGDRWFENRIFPTPDGIAVFFHEITARKRADQALKEREERLRLATESGQLGTWDWNIAAGKVRWDPYLLRLFDLDPGQLSTSVEAWIERVHPEDRIRLRGAIRVALKEQAPWTEEFRVVSPGGQARWVAVEGRALGETPERATRMIGVARDITERRRMEETLRRSEQRFRLAATTGDVWDADVASGTGMIPAQFKRALGYEDAEIENTVTAFGALVHPEDRERWQAGLREHLRNRAPYAFDFRARTKAGSYRWFTTRGQAVWDESGRATYMAGTVFDITERKEAELALRQSEAKLRQIIDGLGPSMFVGLMTPDGVVVEANRPALEAAGLAPGDVLGKLFDQTYWWAYAERVQRQVREAIQRAAAGEPSRYDAQVRVAGGRLVWMDFSLQPLRDDAGRITYLVPSAMVIDERKHAEQAVRESAENFRQLAENIREVFWLTDPAKAAMLYISPAYEEIWGRTIESLYASPRAWLEAIHPADRERVQASAHSKQATGDYDEEYRIVRPDGAARWIRDRAFPVRDASGAVYRIAGVAEDITERKRAQALETGRRAVLRMIAERAPLRDTLHALVRFIEEQSGEMLGSILLLDEDGKHLRHGAAPSLPASFTAEIDGEPIGEAAGSCGTAAHRRAQVISEDIATDPLWTSYREIALAHGLLACWSTPVLDEHQRVLGTFAMYFRSIRAPREQDYRLIELATDTAAIAISREREELAIRASETRFRLLAESSPDAVLIHSEGRIVFVNRAMVDLLGATRADDLVGRSATFMLDPEIAMAARQRIAALYGGTPQPRAEQVYRRLDGTAVEVEIAASPLTLDGRPAAQVTVRDITQRKVAEARIEHLATHDALTDLPNRALIHDRITQAIAHARRARRQFAVLYLDLDRFKTVNDGFGHAFGDELLKAVAARLCALVRDGDTVARQSGDEFLILLADLRRSADAYIVAQKILEAIERPFALEDRETFVTASIGVSIYPQDAETADALIADADVAMYRSKDLGRNTYQFFTREMSEETRRKVDLETRLRGAIAGSQLQLAYQPKVELGSGRIIGCEALLRWTHPDLGAVSPAHFIPVAEDSGLIVPIGDWVLRTACAQNKAWAAAGLPPVVVSVNLSARQFLQQDVVTWVMQVLADTGLAPQLLELELTESLIAQDVEKVIDTVNRLKAAGVVLSIDDFGTGYSSLSYLKRFRVDTLKIDQSFVRNLLVDPSDATISRAVISLAHSLGMKVVAEGVETAEHCAFLRKHGCDAIQGYYFSKPVPVTEMQALLRSGKCLPATQDA